jgi:tRNA pseudouridine55 synthase
MDGIINLDKPPGISSAAALNRLKRLFPRGTKIGHAGTLDPFATGVLVVLVGKATRSCERLMNQPKRYQATITFGATTPSDDPETPATPTPQAVPPPIDAIEAAIRRYVGTIQQRPPVYSALKVSGRRACDLARDGSPVDLPARPIRIDAIEIVQYAWPNLTLLIDCGRGTYIRAIARDLGNDLAVGGYLSSLRRTRVGDFYVENSVTLDSLAADGPSTHLTPLSPGM